MTYSYGTRDSLVRGRGHAASRVRAGVVALLLLSMLLTGCSGGSGDDAPEPGEQTSGIVPGSAGAPAVSWAGDGRYAVVQFYKESRYPSVMVWDSQSEETRVLDGYRVLFAETAAPVVWLEPVTAREVDQSTWFDGLSDSLDHVPARLMAWRLDDGSEPSARVPSKWRPIPGPGGYVAYPEISVLKGAGPSALWFNNAASSGEGVKVAIPESTVSFSPVGWSPSGKYFAIEELSREEDVVFPGYTETSPAPVRLLVVFDVITGKVSTTAELPATAVVGPGAVWDAAQDRLYWPVEPDPVAEGAGPVVIRTMTATGAAADAFEELGWERTGDLSLVYDAGVAGVGSQGALLALEGGLFAASASGLERVGDLAAVQAAATPAGLIARVRYATDEDAKTGWLELVITDGQGDRVVWKSPAENLSE